MHESLVWTLCWSLGLTLAISVGTIGYLYLPLRRVLGQVCQTPERAAFWQAFSNVVFVLVPLICMLGGFVGDRWGNSIALQVIDQFRWSLVGLVLAVICVAIAVAAITSGLQHSIAVSDDQVDDIHRLLEKVEELRRGKSCADRKRGNLDVKASTPAAPQQPKCFPRADTKVALSLRER